MRSFYKAQSNLDDFEKDHPEAVREGKYHRKILSAWIGRKLRDRETSVVGSASLLKVAEEKTEPGKLPLIPILEDNRTSISMAVHGRGLDGVKLAVNKQPRAVDLQWTDGGTEFRTIVEDMKVFAELCDVRFSCQDGRPAFGFRYRISGADWLEVYMHGDGPGTEHSGKAFVRVAVLSHERGTELHDLTLEGVWFGDDTGPEWPFEAELRLWYEGVQMLPPFHRYERGFWSKRQASDTEADRKGKVRSRQIRERVVLGTKEVQRAGPAPFVVDEVEAARVTGGEMSRLGENHLEDHVRVPLAHECHADLVQPAEVAAQLVELGGHIGSRELVSGNAGR